MPTHEDPSLLLENLSDRVLRSLSARDWRRLFLQPRDQVMRFEPAHGTLLCATMQLPRWGSQDAVHAELRALAHCHGGEYDPCPEGAVLVRFDDAHAALEMARDMQRMSCEVRFQVGLVTGDCVRAVLLALESGEPLAVLLGAHVEQAAVLAQRAAAGTIRMAASTRAVLGAAGAKAVAPGAGSDGAPAWSRGLCVRGAASGFAPLGLA